MFNLDSISELTSSLSEAKYGELVHKSYPHETIISMSSFLLAIKRRELNIETLMFYERSIQMVPPLGLTL